ncbi:HNH endonuclease [Rufibacter ruber]|uniref:HNH endonuclease n=1 Tax=Rufibacter ruber TaxID=1783499 RepID=UPI00137A18E4|nr:HNH endonuclease [Rufibacter ruber]
MAEEWREIIIEGQAIPGYRISSRGEVLSTKYKEPRILRPGLNQKGYAQVSLRNGDRYQKCLVHRLVAEAFIPNPNGLPIVDHIDTDPLNNCVENLRWVNARTNMQNRRKRLEGNTTSVFVGVHQVATTGRWVAKICYEYKNFNLGTFETEVEAAKKYDRALIEMGFEPANFPMETYLPKRRSHRLAS